MLQGETAVSGEATWVTVTGASDWREVDARLRRIARRRGRLDHEEMIALRDAMRVQVWREVGCASMREYLERVFGYGPRAASDRLRVASALDAMPELDDALDSGELPYSAVREIARVATSRTARAWVDACRGKCLRDVEDLVAQHAEGDLPDAPPREHERPQILRLELEGSDYALWRQARQVLEGERDEAVSDRELFAAACTALIECSRMGACEPPPPERAHVGNDARAEPASTERAHVGLNSSAGSTERAHVRIYSSAGSTDRAHVGLNSSAGSTERAHVRIYSSAGSTERAHMGINASARSTERAHVGINSSAEAGSTERGDAGIAGLDSSDVESSNVASTAREHGGAEAGSTERGDAGITGLDSSDVESSNVASTARGHGGTQRLGSEAQRGRAKYQIAVVVCEACKRGWQEGGGKRIPISEVAVARAECDAQHVGSLDGAPQTAEQDVPPKTRRFVFRRDGDRCTVPGCRASSFIEVHHIVHREHGGGNEPENLTLLCGGHHDAHHAGRLVIRGSAPDLTFELAGERLAPAVPRAHVGTPAIATNPCNQDVRQMRADAVLALHTLGFKKPEATVAIDAALASATPPLDLETLLRLALQRCPR